MATGWVKSLQCKSKAYEDVYDPINNPPPHPKHLNYNLISSGSCRKSVQSIRDVIEVAAKNHKPRKPKKHKSIPSKKPTSKPARAEEKPVGEFNQVNRVRVSSNSSTWPVRVTQDGSYSYPTLTELVEGQSSRNVVEIIFHTSWSPPMKPFAGKVEMVFKVQNLPRTVSRFEEYREAVKSRAGSGSVYEDDARCIADGNEVMRFHCLGPTTSGVLHDGVGGGAWGIGGGKGLAICTFSGSGLAHENAGGGRGRRAMLVCRVIAGRISKRLGVNPSSCDRVRYESVSGDNGELVVFDSRAVLPCFLIIYKL